MFSSSGKIFIKLTFEASFALDKFSRIFTKLFRDFVENSRKSLNFLPAKVSPLKACNIKFRISDSFLKIPVKVKLDQSVMRTLIKI